MGIASYFFAKERAGQPRHTAMTTDLLRIVFMGTPDFAATILRSVAAWEGGSVVAAYAQPDRPAGRGHKLREPDVKAAARELGIPVFQPRNFREQEDRDALAALQPDVLVVAAYGLILPQAVLDIPRLGAFNVHASLLPRHRGAAPIQRAIMEGDEISGVTIMRMEKGLDTGPILLQQALSLEKDETAGSLFDLLAEHGAKLMVGALGMIAEGRAAFVPQNEELASYAAKIAPQEEYPDWKESAEKIHAHIRGITPFPGAKTLFRRADGENFSLRLAPGEIAEDEAARRCAGLTPGTVAAFDGRGLLVACGEGAYRITRLKPAGKQEMSAADFFNGRLRTVNMPCGMLETPPDMQGA